MSLVFFFRPPNFSTSLLLWALTPPPRRLSGCSIILFTVRPSFILIALKHDNIYLDRFEVWKSGESREGSYRNSAAWNRGKRPRLAYAKGQWTFDLLPCRLVPQYYFCTLTWVKRRMALLLACLWRVSYEESQNWSQQGGGLQNKCGKEDEKLQRTSKCGLYS